MKAAGIGPRRFFFGAMMEPHPEPVKNQTAAGGMRLFRILSAGEWLTLLGMVVVVAGASLPWKRFVPPPAAALSAVYVAPPSRTLSGFSCKVGGLSAGWMAVTAAVVCGSLVLFVPSRGELRALLALHTALSALILGLTSYHVGPFAGIYTSITGALLLLAGGAMRYR
jgi:hypothetical protein